jgi:hypothetical protein
VTYLYDPSTCTSSDHCSSRAHVKRVVAVPARANDINDEISIPILDFCFECTSAQHLSGDRQRFRSSLNTINVQRRQESPDLDWMDLVWSEQ